METLRTQLKELQLCSLVLGFGKTPSWTFQAIKWMKISKLILEIDEHMGFYVLLMGLGASGSSNFGYFGLSFIKAFYACKQEEGQSISSYILKMEGYLDQMKCLGFPISKKLGVGLTLNSLSKDYEQFVQNYNIHSTGKTIVELHAMLKLDEKGIPNKANPAPTVLGIGRQDLEKEHQEQTQSAQGKNHGKGKGKEACAPKPKIPPPAKNEHPAKDSNCHHGH
ncbi:hypothetical protein Tco_0435917 [Tanacetum coccineum]